MPEDNIREDKDKTFRALHDLVATCNDAAEGYGKAAKGVHDRDLSDWLAQVSDERERFGSEITNQIGELGGEPRSDLHEGGILHAGWVDLEQSLRPKEESEILLECVAGDSGTLKHYDHALAQNLSASTRSMVEGQRKTIAEEVASLRSRANQSKTQHA